MFTIISGAHFPTEVISKQDSYSNLADVVEGLLEDCKETSNNLPFGYDVTVSLPEGATAFQLLEGEDRTMDKARQLSDAGLPYKKPLIFSRDVDNVSVLTLTDSDLDEIN